MSIYIPGMKMPKNCIDCAFGWNGWCHRINSRAFVEVDMRRHDCPLIEIPPHGRLIDADALDKTIEFIGEAEAQIYGSQNWRFAMKCRQALENAPTIIEAEPCNDLAKPNNAPTIIEAEEVYDKYTDTTGKLHWTGTHSGEHIIPADGGET